MICSSFILYFSFKSSPSLHHIFKIPSRSPHQPPSTMPTSQNKLCNRVMAQLMRNYASTIKTKSRLRGAVCYCCFIVSVLTICFPAHYHFFRQRVDVAVGYRTLGQCYPILFWYRREKKTNVTDPPLVIVSLPSNLVSDPDQVTKSMKFLRNAENCCSMHRVEINVTKIFERTE